MIEFLLQLEKTLLQRKQELPEGSYTSSLFKKGGDRILQKVGEEAVEYILASKNTEIDKTISEGADLLFHFILSLVNQGIPLATIIAELQKRNK